MYLHLGQESMVATKEIVGIFDLDTSTLSKKTRDALAKAQKEGRVVNTGPDLPRSFVLTRNSSFYISQLSTSTLKSRAESGLNKRFFE